MILEPINLVLTLLACFGLTLILVHGKIFNCPREFCSKKSKWFAELIKCSMCSGWWVGLFFAFLIVWLKTFPVVFYLITIPFASSGICFLLERLVIWIDDNIAE